jgi:uncharacterized membrane protein (DUF485 family)
MQTMAFALATTMPLTAFEVLAFPALMAGVALIIAVADRLGATLREAALLALAVVIMATGMTGLYTIRANHHPAYDAEPLHHPVRTMHD